ncbi:hypothetical protein [Pseudomonas japonica]|uniref:hypothetical protein n=1 Tax=Pseudomonas japonica TaxID=256466 RepID=UPI0015E45B01|nr:hypothetical protein [Pseudomonas japonica]MBA1245682.1 hypothetical protein [Pseudomonas japonica]
MTGENVITATPYLYKYYRYGATVKCEVLDGSAGRQPLIAVNVAQAFKNRISRSPWQRDTGMMRGFFGPNWHDCALLMGHHSRRF